MVGAGIPAQHMVQDKDAATVMNDRQGTLVDPVAQVTDRHIQGLRGRLEAVAEFGEPRIVGILLHLFSMNGREFFENVQQNVFWPRKQKTFRSGRGTLIYGSTLK